MVPTANGAAAPPALPPGTKLLVQTQAAFCVSGSWGSQW